MKGIILAGGNGTRLSPLTNVVSKQLLPVYDKPMIYYPLSTLLLAGVDDILVICKEEDLASFGRLLSSGEHLGVKISYNKQLSPNGIAEALIIGEEFIGGEPVLLILGDNIFHGQGLGKTLRDSLFSPGASMFLTQVANPNRYGVALLDDNGGVEDIEEKPAIPKSNLAITGLYYFDGRSTEMAKELSPSPRGELEVTDLLKRYMNEGTLSPVELARGTAWLDMGTVEALHQAAEYVKVVEERHGLKIGCPEEVAFRTGLIGIDQLQALAITYSSSAYGQYLHDIAKRRA